MAQTRASSAGDACRHGSSHHRVDVTVDRDVLGLPVVGAECNPVRPVLGEQRQQRVQVARCRPLADQQPHAGTQALAALVGRGRLVVGADAGGRVRLKGCAVNAGRVPVDVCREGELLELALGAADHAWEVHHLRKADHPPPAQERVEVAGGQRASRRLEVRRRHA